jgi:hypothetical protein
MNNQQLGVLHISFCLKNRVARGCWSVTAIPRRYRQLQTVPRNTSATRRFLLRSHPDTIGLFVTLIALAALFVAAKLQRH